MKTLNFIPVILLFYSVLLLYPNNLVAQNQDLYRIETIDGNIFTGTLISDDGESVILRVEGIGEITISKGNIRTMVLLDHRRMRDGVYWHENPQATRYFFAPNAIGLGKGKGYYQNTWILFNNVNYGLSDHFSIGGGIVPLFLFGASVSPVWILPKVTVPVSEDTFHLGAGAMIGGLIGSETEALGLIYGVGTIGNRDKNLTVGVGYGYAGGEISQTPLLNVSGIIRTSRRLYLLSENYFITSDGFTGIISFGARWTAENFAVDFGLFRPLEEAGRLIGVPWLGVTIPFGSR